MTRKQYVDSLLYEFYKTKNYDPTVLIMHPKMWDAFKKDLHTSTEFSLIALITFNPGENSSYKGLTIYRTNDINENDFVIK